ncbi:hypothetical protein Tco_1208731, partial [Tanacetum coccineum]
NFGVLCESLRKDVYFEAFWRINEEFEKVNYSDSEYANTSLCPYSKKTARYAVSISTDTPYRRPDRDYKLKAPLRVFSVLFHINNTLITEDDFQEQPRAQGQAPNIIPNEDTIVSLEFSTTKVSTPKDRMTSGLLVHELSKAVSGLSPHRLDVDGSTTALPSKVMHDTDKTEEELTNEEIVEAMAKTMEQYMNKTRDNCGSGIARPRFEANAQFELKGQILKEL